MRSALTVALAVGLVGGATAPAASGATLHVSPQRFLIGSTTLPCVAANPCNLAFALTAAAAGDDVAMAPGDYRVPVLTPLQTQGPYTTTLVVKPGVVLHGDPARPLPVIHSRVAVIDPAVRVEGGGVLRDVAIEATAPPGVNYGYGVIVAGGALVERSRIRWTGVAGTVGTACAMVGGTVRSSECLGTGAAGTAHALTGTGSGNIAYVVRNVTAITTSPGGHGVRLGTSSFTTTMIVTNVIARGPAGDLSVRAGLTGGIATMVVDHSNWVTQDVVAQPGRTVQLFAAARNQTGATAAEPLFVNPAAGDYRVSAGSPTIDAGLTDPSNGPLALGGLPRTIGASTDMGADEFAPPAPPIAPTAPIAPPAAGTPAGTPGAARVAPVLTGLRMGRSWTRRAGTTIRFTLSEAATVRLVVSQPATGRRVGRVCRAATPALRARPRCARPNPRGVHVVRAREGANAVRFAGRLSRRLLAPGAYRLTATAIDGSGDRSAPRAVRFRIRR